MSITRCTEYKKRSGNLESGEKRNTREYTRTWLVVSDTFADDSYTILNGWSTATGITWGTAFPSDSLSFAKKFQADAEADDSLNWVVTCTYGQYPYASPNDCPWEQPAKVKWSPQQYEQSLDQSPVDNTAFLNSAGDPFANPIVRDQTRIVLTVTQAEETWDGSLALNYCDVINSNSYMGAAPYTFKSIVGAESEWSTKWGFYWTVNYELQYNPDTWRKTVLDCGYYYIDQSSSTKRPIMVNGALATSPQLLYDTGAICPKGGTPHWFTFKVYTETTFAFSWRLPGG